MSVGLTLFRDYCRCSPTYISVCDKVFMQTFYSDSEYVTGFKLVLNNCIKEIKRK